MDAVVSVAGLAKRYGDLTAVADVSFDVAEGEIFGVLGPNGAGKTTSVECIQGLRHPDSGRIRVLGLDPRTEGERLRALIGSQLQESALPHRLRVGEALELFSSLQPGGPPWQQVMADWGLVPKARSAFGSLSGGQRQRLLVALAVVNAPKVVFLDEMTTGLDPVARRATWDLIERIRQAGTTVVLVTHFMDEAERLCHRLAVIDRGQLIALGTPRELIARHIEPQVVEVYGEDAPGWAQAHAAGYVRRYEVTGETAFCYVQDAKALIEHLETRAGLRYLHRPANLEDVFLKLTGRELRD